MRLPAGIKGISLDQQHLVGAMRAAVPRGTSLRAAPGHLSLLSYNLLAPLYVRPIDQRTGNVQAFAAFPWAEPADKVLDWTARQPRLHAELCASEADVIALQEVQFETRGDGDGETFALPTWLDLDGYCAAIPPQRDLQAMAARNERVLASRTAIGNALLYRTDRLVRVEDNGGGGGGSGGGSGGSGKVSGGKSGGQPNAKPRSDTTTRVGACLRGRPDSSLAALEPLAIFCVHLDATSEEQRVKQLGKCLEQARTHFGTRSVLIAGDMNTELLPGSCVRAYLTEGACSPKAHLSLSPSPLSPTPLSPSPLLPSPLSPSPRTHRLSAHGHGAQFC